MPDVSLPASARGVWYDAAGLVPAWYEGPIPLDPSDRGLLLADGLFDTALVLGGRMAWRDAHVERLLAGCRLLGIALDPARVARALAAVLPRINYGSLRITVTRGAGPRGLAPPARPHPTLMAAPAALAPAALFAPARLRTATTRRNDLSPLCGVKSLAYADNVLAAAEARLADGAEALLLNTRGRVACAASANLFAVRRGRLVTPPCVDGALDGVARGVLLALAADLDLGPAEASLELADLEAADAVMATSSLRLVSPVVEVDGRALACSLDLAQRVEAAMAEAIRVDVGIDPRRLTGN